MSGSSSISDRDLATALAYLAGELEVVAAAAGFSENPRKRLHRSAPGEKRDKRAPRGARRNRPAAVQAREEWRSRPVFRSSGARLHLIDLALQVLRPRSHPRTCGGASGAARIPLLATIRED